MQIKNRSWSIWIIFLRSSRTLPPLQALRAFEATGRLLSFRKAGEELLITQSAVSHHIAQLEAGLGAALFVRKARGISFTLAGERYFRSISDAFGIISIATTLAHTEGCLTPPLRVSLLPSFAANWLVPRLAQWRRTYPDIVIDLDPTLRTVDIAGGEADVAIRYGDGSWIDVASQLLLPESVTPVISPLLMARGPKIIQPTDILKYPLLYSARPTDWGVWAESVDVDLRGAQVIQLTDYNIVIQAAVDGQGVALGRAMLVADRLRSGALVQPLLQTASSARICYWLVTRRTARPNPAVVQFTDWIKLEAKLSAV